MTALARSRTISVLLCLPVFAACSDAPPKHACAFTSEAERKELGALAGMTEGAAECRIYGEPVDPARAGNIVCAVGSEDCMPTMEATFGDGRTADAVRTGYRRWLEEHGWRVSERQIGEGAWTLDGARDESRGHVFVMVVPGDGKTVFTMTKLAQESMP